MMPCNIAVCVKPVPDPNYYDQVTIDLNTKTIARAGIPSIVNPVDKNAMETALKLKERYNGTIAIFSMAPISARENILELLAMGADRAYLLSSSAFAGSDTLATSYILNAAINKAENMEECKFDLVLCGHESADGATAQVPPQLGEWRGVPHLGNVCSLTLTDENIFHVTTKQENSFIDWELVPPAVLSVSREINSPRHISAVGIVKAPKKPFVVWERDDLTFADNMYIGVAGSATLAGEVFIPNTKRKTKEFNGTPDEIADIIVSLLAKRVIAISGLQ